ncbi:MAG TPA: beta-eliminating lyase-related protein [Bacteroidia bacterium]
MKENTRRDFLKKMGMGAVPLLLPSMGLDAATLTDKKEDKTKKSERVNFIFDGILYPPINYIDKLKEIHVQTPIRHDFYGHGGATKALEETFAKLTGKEKAIYVPTGTMANQLAIKLLNGNNTKIIVPENSHVYRDEADAAQSVHNKRLIPVGKGKPYYELKDLIDTINYLDNEEVFKSGLGTVMIENPVRRADGAFVPFETIKEISAWCRKNGYKLHLDGSRLHIAAAYANVTVAEYASQFDTVYISLYKYLNAAGGAMLCGDATIIDQMEHEIKILGGTMFQTWTNTAMALHYVKDIDEKWQKIIVATKALMAELNKTEGVSVTEQKNGTNIYYMKVNGVNREKLANFLYEKHNMLIGEEDNGTIMLIVNESILFRSTQELAKAWKEGIETSRIK